MPCLQPRGCKWGRCQEDPARSTGRSPKSSGECAKGRAAGTGLWTGASSLLTLPPGQPHLQPHLQPRHSLPWEPLSGTTPFALPLTAMAAQGCAVLPCSSKSLTCRERAKFVAAAAQPPHALHALSKCLRAAWPQGRRRQTPLSPTRLSKLHSDPQPPCDPAPPPRGWTAL